MPTQDTPITPSLSSLPPQADPVLPVSDLSDVLFAKSAEDLEKKDIPLSIDEFSLDLPDIAISSDSTSLTIDMPSESLPSAGIKISDSIQTDSLANLVESPAISEVSKQESIAPSQVSVEPLVSEQILENPQQPSPVEEIVLDITPVVSSDQSQTSDISNDLGNMMDTLPQAETTSESVTQTPTPSTELSVELLPQSQPVETSTSSDSSPLTLDLPQETPKQEETLKHEASIPDSIVSETSEKTQIPVMISENTIPQTLLQEPVVLQDSPSISEVPTSQSPQELPSPIETPVQNSVQIIDSQTSSLPQSSATFDIDTLWQSQPSAVVPNTTTIPQEQVSPQPSMPMPVDIDAMLWTLEKTPSSTIGTTPVGMMFPPQTTMNPGVSGLIAPTSSFTAQPTLNNQTSWKKTSILPFILTLLLAVGGRFFAQTMWPIETQALLDEAKSIIQPYLGGVSENVSSNTGSLAEWVSTDTTTIESWDNSVVTGDENTIVATGEELSASWIVDTGSLLSSGSVESTGKVHNAADITGQNISGDSKLKDLEEVFVDTSLSGQITVLKTMVTQTTELLKKGKELQDREIVRNALYVRKKSQELLDQLEKGTQMDTKELTNKIQTLQPFLDKAKQASLDASQTSPTSSTGMSQ